MLSDLAAGAAMVIAEGRESGTVGLFDDAGDVHGELVDAILHAVGQETVIFEAPRRAQQAWLLRRIGPNVNLGNIAPDEVIALETLRRGLRFDTLDLLPSRTQTSSGARARRRRSLLRRAPAARARRSSSARHAPSIASIGAGAAPPMTVREAIAAAGSSASPSCSSSGRPSTSRAAASSALTSRPPCSATARPTTW